MPKSLSRDAGRKAVEDAGACWAKSGIQEWKGKAPALVKLPIIRVIKAHISREDEVARLSSLMFQVPASCQMKAMPRIMIPSEAPMMIRVFLAAAELLSSWPLMSL